MSMTILQLKQELINHGVSLPEATARKEVYEKLYQEFVVKSKSKTRKSGAAARRDDFSSDDEVPGSSGNGIGHDEDEVEILDPAIALEVESLSNEEIYIALTNLGQNIGPVVSTTRDMYKKKLIKLWSQNGHFNVQSGVANGSAENEHEFQLNGHTNENADGEIPRQFSSDEEEIEILDKVVNTTSRIEKQSGGPLTKEEKKKLELLMTPRSFASSSNSPYPSTSEGKGLELKTKKSSAKKAGGGGMGMGVSLKVWIVGFMVLLLAVYIGYEIYTENSLPVDKSAP